MSIFALTLTPNSFDNRPKALTIPEGTWKKAVELVERTQFRPNHVGGLAKSTTKPFARALRQAMSREKLDESIAKGLSDLLTFLAGPGAGGFDITRGFQSWRQA
jgi:hypothetical protein